MKAIIQPPCCGAHIEVEADTTDELAVKLNEAMNDHYEAPAFKCKTLADWWTVAAAAEIGLLIEDGETLEQEYERLLGRATSEERKILMWTFGCLIGVDVVMTGGRAAPVPVPEVSLREQIAFQEGMNSGGTNAVIRGYERRYVPNIDLRGITATEEELEAALSGDSESIAAVPPVDARRAFEEMKTPVPGSHVH
jgi:hypothetical protein